MAITKSHEQGVGTSLGPNQSFFYKPGAKAAGPMAMYVTVQGQPSGANLLIGVYQVINGVNRPVRQRRVATTIAEVYHAADGSTHTWTHTLTNHPVAPHTVTVTATVGGLPVIFTDDGNGNIVDSNGVVRGTIAYLTGVSSITWVTPPDNSTNVTVTYGTAVTINEGVCLIDLDGFESYAQLVFAPWSDQAGGVQFFADIIGRWDAY